METFFIALTVFLLQVISVIFLFVETSGCAFPSATNPCAENIITNNFILILYIIVIGFPLVATALTLLFSKNEARRVLFIAYTIFSIFLAFIFGFAH
jgi:uncharacterized membrane protein YagU involved in acid resistance